MLYHWLYCPVRKSWGCYEPSQLNSCLSTSGVDNVDKLFTLSTCYIASYITSSQSSLFPHRVWTTYPLPFIHVDLDRYAVDRQWIKSGRQWIFWGQLQLPFKVFFRNYVNVDSLSTVHAWLIHHLLPTWMVAWIMSVAEDKLALEDG